MNSASSSSLSPPCILRGRASSITNPLTLNSARPRSNSQLLPDPPQTPGALVRKDTAPTTNIRASPSSSAAASAMDDEHPGSPHRPMLSVLLSLSAGALPQFVRPMSYEHGEGPARISPLRYGKRTAPRPRSRVWDASETEQVGPPPSPFTSLFIAPPHPISLLPTPSDPATIRRHRSTSYAPILLLLSIFVLSLFPVIAALSSLPITAFRSLPRTLSDIALLGRELQAYADSGTKGLAHVLAVLSITAIWKHSWSIPGSVVLNVIAGAILSPIPGTLFMTLLTTIGSLSATLLSTPLAPLVSSLFPRALLVTRTALEGSPSISIGDDVDNEKNTSARSPVWVRLVVMRLVGVVPWSGINVACGVCGVSLWDCAIGGFIGTLPWTAVTCQVGDIIQTLSSASAAAALDGAAPQTLSSVLTSPGIILKLTFLSLLSLGPVLGREKLRSVLGGSATSDDESEEDERLSHREKVPRWMFWRRGSRNQSRRGSIHDIDSEEGEEILLEK